MRTFTTEQLDALADNPMAIAVSTCKAMVDIGAADARQLRDAKNEAFDDVIDRFDHGIVENIQMKELSDGRIL